MKKYSGAQRNFMSIVHHCEWDGLCAEAAAAGDRELTRLISVCGPHSGDYLNAIPVSAGMRVDSLVWEQTTQRRLGLHISGAPEADPFGDLIINSSAHGHRHFLVNAVWARALKSVYGANFESEPASWRQFSTTRPDGCAFNCAFNGKHVLYETKVATPISASSGDGPARQGQAGTLCAFGNTDKHFLTKILGTPNGDGAPPSDGDYRLALARGQTVVPLIHEVFGGLAPGANATLRDLGQRKQGRLDEPSASWSARSFVAYYGQLLSIATAIGVSGELTRGINAARRMSGAVIGRSWM